MLNVAFSRASARRLQGGVMPLPTTQPGLAETGTLSMSETKCHTDRALHRRIIPVLAVKLEGRRRDERRLGHESGFLSAVRLGRVQQKRVA